MCKLIKENLLEFIWICVFLEMYDQQIDGPTNGHTHGQTKPFIDLLFATKKYKMVNEIMTQWQKKIKIVSKT